MSLKRFVVPVTRTSTRTVNIEVMTENKRFAEEVALNEAYDVNFSNVPEKESDYDVFGEVEEV